MDKILKQVLEKGKNKNKGITLIALVITIIVLLILAGVAIATLTGDNGILTKATDAKKSNEEAAALEKIKVEVLGSYNQEGKIDIDELNKNLKRITGFKYKDKELSDSNKIEKLPALIELDNNSYLIKSDGTTIPTNSQPLECLTSNNYGDYIDLGKNVIGDSNSTADDWRILYNDTENKVLYAILADYLPNDNDVVKTSGLNAVDNTIYNINFTNRENLLSKVNNNKLWEGLVSDDFIDKEVTVAGAISADLLLDSYNEKYDANLSYASHLRTDPSNNSSPIDTLYMPHPDKGGYRDCYGYWLNTTYSDHFYVYRVYSDGTIWYHNANSTQFGIRPVVSLPSNIEMIKTISNGKIVWSIPK